MEAKMEINLNENATANHVNHVVVMMIAETEKAFKVERYIESKGKNYTAFIPKKALRNVGNAERAIFMEKWFEAKLTGFDRWFFNAK